MRPKDSAADLVVALEPGEELLLAGPYLEESVETTSSPGQVVFATWNSSLSSGTIRKVLQPRSFLDLRTSPKI